MISSCVLRDLFVYASHDTCVLRHTTHRYASRHGSCMDDRERAIAESVTGLTNMRVSPCDMTHLAQRHGSFMDDRGRVTRPTHMRDSQCDMTHLYA